MYPSYKKELTYESKIGRTIAITWRGRSKFKLVMMMLGVTSANLAIWALLGYLFQRFWSWYMPVWWGGAPVLGYWQALATFALLVLVHDTLRHPRKNE